MKLLRRTQPLWVILENVDLGTAESPEGDTNYGVIQSALSDAGYETRSLATVTFQRSQIVSSYCKIN